MTKIKACIPYLIFAQNLKWTASFFSKIWTGSQIINTAHGILNTSILGLSYGRLDVILSVLQLCVKHEMSSITRC